MQVNWSVYKNNQKELEKLWEAAHIDNLTKLYNRYGMETWITQKLEEKSAEDVATMLIIDVDNFKHVNDTFGHMLGDALLVDIADIIRSFFPDGYLCGRIGGDEYQIFAMNVSKAVICDRAQKMCDLLKDKYTKEHQNYNISISIGIAFSEDNRGHDYGDLYKMADIALYQAKLDGKNGYMLYGENSCYKSETTSESYADSCSDSSRMRTAFTEEQYKQYIMQNIQIGDSGFSSSKVLLDAVIDELSLHHDTKTTIENIAKLIVDAFDVTRAYASCYMADEMHVGKSYFYAQNDDYNIPPNLQISAHDYERQCFNNDHIFFCTDIENTVEPFKSELKRMQVQTLLQVLIHRGDKIIGTLGINNCGYKRLWQQSEIEVIHTIAKLITEVIYQLQLECEAEAQGTNR